MTQKSTPIIYYEKERIAFLEINRPDKKNALNYECWQLFDEYFEKLMSNSKIRALVIQGRTDDIFSAGFDVTPTDKFIGDMFQAQQNGDKAKLVDGFAGDKNVVYSLGTVGHGVSMTQLNGRTVADLILERQTELTEVFFVNRRTIPWPPEPIRNLAVKAILGYMHWEDRIYDPR